MSIGRNIRQRRQELGMTLEEVAKQVHVSRQTLSRYENGVISNIPSDKIESLAEALLTTPTYIMGWDMPLQNRDSLNVAKAKLAAAVTENPQLPSADRLELAFNVLGSVPAEVGASIGVNPGVMESWAYDGKLPSSKTVDKVLSYLDVPVSVLLNDEERSVYYDAKLQDGGLNSYITDEELSLLIKYRSLDSKQKNYILQTLDMISGKTQ